MNLSYRQQAAFFSQLAALLRSGISLSRACALVGQDLPAGFRRRLHLVQQELDRGQSFPQASRHLTADLTPWQRQVLYLGDTSGALEMTCHHLGEATWRDHQREHLYRGIRWHCLRILWGCSLIAPIALFHWSAFSPALWLGGSLWAAILYLTLPQIPRWLGGLWWAIGRNLPLIQTLIEAQSMIYLAQLALPLRSGLSIAAALEALGKHTPDPHLTPLLQRWSRQTRQGQPLAPLLPKQIPTLVRQMVQTGETSGQIEDSLTKVEEYYMDALEHGVKRLGIILKVLSVFPLGIVVLQLWAAGFQEIQNSLPQI